jgi:hypothetical protein
MWIIGCSVLVVGESPTIVKLASSISTKWVEDMGLVNYSCTVLISLFGAWHADNNHKL